jgi:hypothetical protein
MGLIHGVPNFRIHNGGGTLGVALNFIMSIAITRTLDGLGYANSAKAR